MLCKIVCCGLHLQGTLLVTNFLITWCSTITKLSALSWYCSIKPIGGPLWFFEHKVCLHKQMPVLKRKHLHILNSLDLFQITWWLWEKHGLAGPLMFFNNIQMACPLLARLKCCPIPGRADVDKVRWFSLLHNTCMHLNGRSEDSVKPLARTQIL